MDTGVQKKTKEEKKITTAVGRHQLHCIYVSPLTQSIANRVYTQEVRTELATKEEWRPILFGPDLIRKTLEDKHEEQDL